MFVATFISFLACTNACLAEFLSNPIETSVAIESSGGSGADCIGAGLFLCNQYLLLKLSKMIMIIIIIIVKTNVYSDIYSIQLSPIKGHAKFMSNTSH